VQRIRRSGFSSAVSSRVVLAVFLSIVAHTYFVFGLPSRPTSNNSSKGLLIEARLIREEPTERQPPVVAPFLPENFQPPPRTVPMPALPFVLPPVVVQAPPPLAMPLPEPESVVEQPVSPSETRLQEPIDLLPGEESASLEVPDLAFHPASELDVYPSITQPVIPPIPEAAAARGVVTLLLMIDEFGKVNDAKLLDSEPAGQYDEAVMRAYARAKFSPAQKDARAVRSRILVRVDIEPQTSVVFRN
jgi:TonB family protein